MLIISLCLMGALFAAVTAGYLIKWNRDERMHDHGQEGIDRR